MDGNPINYNDLVNFSDDSVIKNAISSLNALKAAYQQFIDTVIAGQLTKLNEQQEAVAASAKTLSDTTKTLNITNEANQKLLLENAKLMQQLDAANKKLNDTRAAAKKIADGEAGSVTKLTEQLVAQLAVYKKMGDATIADIEARNKQAEAISNTKSAIAALTTITKANVQAYTAAAGSYNELDAATKKLVADLKNLPGGMSATSKEAKELQAQIYANTQKLKEFDAGMNQNFRNVGNYKSALSSLGSSLVQLGAGYFGLQAIIGYAGSIVKSNEEIGDSLVLIRQKAGETTAEVNNLEEQLKKIDTRTSLKDLVDIAGIGAKRGVGKDDLLAFTENLDKVNLALNGSIEGGAEGVATALAKINSLFGENIKLGVPQALKQTGAALVELGQHGITTSENLTDFATRTAAVTTLFKLSLPQVLAYGSAFQEAGFDAERGGTAFNKLLVLLASKEDKYFAIAKLGDANLTLQKFTDLINNNANGALQKFFAGLSSGNATAVEMTQRLADLGLKAGNVTASILGLAENQPKLQEELARSQKAFEDSDVVLDQAAIKNDTLGASVDKLKKEFVAITTSGAIADFFKQIVDGARAAITELEQMVNVGKKLGTGAFLARLVDFGGGVSKNQDTALGLSDSYDSNKQYIQQKVINGKSFDGQSPDQLRQQLKEMQGYMQSAVADYNLFSKELQQGLLKDNGAQGKYLSDYRAQADLLNGEYKQLVVAILHADEAQKKLGVTGTSTTKEVADNLLKSIPEIKARIKELTDLPDSGVVGSDTNKRIIALNERLKELHGTTHKVKDGFAELEQQLRTYQDALQDSLINDYAKGQGKASEKTKEFADRVVALTDKINKLKIAQEEANAAAQLRFDFANRGSAPVLSAKGINPSASDEAQGLSDALGRSALQGDANKQAGIQADASLKYLLDDTKLLALYKQGVLTKAEYDEQAAKNAIDENETIYQSEKKRLADLLGLQTVGTKEYNSLKEQEAKLEHDHAAKQIADAEKVEAARQAAIKQTIAFMNQSIPLISAQLGKGFGEFFKTLGEGIQDFAINSKLSLTDTLQLAGGLVQSFTDISNDASNARIQQLQVEHDQSLSLAGNNAAAKKKIDDNYNAAVAKERTKQAKANKEDAMFQIAINTAIAVVKALPNIPLSVAIGILGLAEEILVASKPIPKYFTGREGGPGEIAIVNDRGPELLEKNGKFRMAAGGKETVTFLEPGEKVHTASKTAAMLHEHLVNANMSEDFVDNLLMGTRVLRAKENDLNDRLVHAFASNSLNAHALKGAFMDAVSQIPVTQIVQDENGYQEYLVKKNLKINAQYERRRAGGNG